MATFHPNLYFQKKKKTKNKVRQEAKPTGLWKQKALFTQSTLQIKQIQNKLKQDWVIHISNKLKEKTPIIFHSISHQRTHTTDLMRWWLYPCPQGLSLPLLHRSENSHICPHFTSLPTSSLPRFKLFGFTQLPACSFFLLSFDFYHLQEKINTQNHASD